MKNMWKKLVVAVFVFALALTGINLLSVGQSKVAAADSTEESVKYYVQTYTGTQVKAYKDANTAPVPTPEEGSEKYNDWIFAGWFTNEACTAALGETINEEGTYYAKYVPSEVLSVKAQVKVDTTVESEKTDMRLVATVDSLNYKSVGFEVYYNGSTTPVKIKSTTVYSRIEAAKGGVDYGFSPNIFDTQSEYFVTATLKNIANKNFDKSFYIRPYWETLDGTITYGVSRYARVEDSYLNIVNVPVRVVSDETTATTGTINVSYDTTYFTYADAYTSTLLNDTVTSTQGYVNGEIFDSVTVDGTTTAGTVTITGTAAEAQKVNGEVVHLRLQVAKDSEDNTKFVTLPKKNTFTVTSSDLTTGVVVNNSVYNYFGIAASYSGVADTSWYDANETEFVITTAEELYGLALLVNGGQFTTETVYLGSDIVVNTGTPEGDDGVWGTGDDDWSTVAPTHNWTPIAKQGTTKFSGTFDGKGHTISGIYASQTYSGVGFFGEITSGANVRNFKLTDSYFVSTKSGVAAICGWYAVGTIEDIYTDAYVKATTDHAGGLVMGCNAKTTIRNCWFAGRVDATKYVGGISGFISASGITIESCLNTGTINGTSQVGGILGRVAAPVTVNDTLSTGTVTVNTSTTSGAIAGWIGTVSGSVGSVTCNNAYSNSSKLYHTLQTASNTITGAQTVADLNGVAAYNNTELDFENYWVLRQSATPVLKSWCESGALYVPKTDWTGDGTEKSPYIITTPEQLYGLASSVNAGETYEGKYFKLGANITINSGTASRWEDEAPKYTWPVIGAYGWHTDYSRSFAGSFDGVGYTVKGLYANRTGLKNPSASDLNSVNNWCAALFGRISQNSIVKNVKVTNSYFEGGYYIAGVVGDSQAGTIQNVYSDAIVKATGGNSGGVVGRLVNGTIEGAWFDGSITNAGQMTGGVVGVGAGEIFMNNCLSTGTVTSTTTSNNTYTGGLIGCTQGNSNITNSLSSAKVVSAKTYCVGSVLGGISTGIETTITNTYTVEGICTATVGTQVKPAEAGTVVGGATECASLTGANAYKNTYLTFDRHEAHLPANEQHDGVWVARPGKAPGLKNFVDEDDVLQIVKQDTYRADTRWYNTTDTTFTINSAEEFTGFMQLVNNGTSFDGKTVQLGADIALNAGKASDWYAGKGETNLYNWIPIGNGDSIKFSGTFDGKGHTISGVYADHKANGIGLFGRVAAGSVVRDFKLTNSYFAGNSGVGSVAGWYAHGTYDTIYSDAIVHGLTSSGGHYGGMLGLLGVDSTIKNCWFAGTIKSNYGYTGGIVGSILNQANTTIESCLNTGNITGTYDIGGIVGRVTAACTIKDSFSKATLKSTTSSGWLGHIAGRVIGVQVTCDRVYALGSNLTMFKPDGAGTLAGTYASVADLTGANGFLNTWLSFDRPELPTPTTGYWVAVADSTPVLKSFLGDAERVSLDGQNLYRVDTRWYDETKAGSETIGDVTYATYIIDTAEELIGFASLVDYANLFENTIVYLGADIVVNTGNAADWAAGTAVAGLYEWNPVGDFVANSDYTEAFTGIFNGQGHSISGLYTLRDGSGVANWAAGLFEKIDGSAEVKNVKVLNSYFQCLHYGGVVGTYNGSNIENVYTDAIIKTTSSSGGGIAGAAYSGTIKNCQFDGTLTNNGQYTGGITGIANGVASIENCLITGSVITKYASNNQYMGGIIGIIQANTTIKDCLCDLKELNPNKAYCSGSVAGFVNSGLTITSSNVYVIDGIYDKVLGIKTSATSTAFSTDPTVCTDLDNYKGYMNTNLDFDNTWVAMEESAPRLQIFAPAEGRFDTTSWYTKAAEGAGTTAENPYIIDSLADLYGFTKRVKDGNTFESQYIRLTKSIVANTVEDDSTVAGWATEAPYYVWSPIGGNPNTFSGHFDGGMNTISGLYATGSYGTTNPKWYTGLFGYVTDATIKNVKVEDSYFSAAYYTAGAVGYVVSGTIDSVYSNATTVGTTGNAATIVGAIVDGTIQNAWADGNATAPKYAGGITSFATTGTSTIQHCLNTGEVNATTEQAGGIVGRGDSATLTIDDCLSVGTITSPKNRGTVVGYLVKTPTITSCYGYSSNGIGAGGAAVKLNSLDEIYDAETYERLDAGYWAARVGNYPIPSVFATDADYAKAATQGALYASDTTFEQEQDGTYLISSAAELYGLAYLSQSNSFEGQKFKLTNDITINHQTLDANTTEATSYEWLPIGSQSVPFKGTFNGNGYTISGLYKYFDNTYDKGRWTGLFDTTEGCVVENLNVENTYFTYVYNGVNEDPSRIGTIAGYGGGTFRNISSTASLINDGRGTGGIIGQSITDTVITNCWYGGEAICETTFQSSYLGGLIGFASAGDITIAHSHVSGDVLGGSYHVGGLVGNIQGAVQATITDSMFNGNFKASDDVQGDVFKHGQLVGTLVANANSAAGGKAPSLTVSNCYGVNNFASYDVGALTSYTHTDETVYTPTVTGSGKVSVKEDRLIGYAGNTASLDYSGYWTLTKSGTPMLKSFVKENDVYNGSQLTSLFKLDTFSKTLVDAEEVGAGRYTIKITGSTKSIYDQYCEALDAGIFDPYNNDQSSDLNGEGVYNKVYTSAACQDASNDDWYINATFLATSDTNGTITITVSSAEVLSQHLKADSIVSYAAEDGYTTSGLTPTFHMIEQKYQEPAASYVIQLSNGHLIVIDGGIASEAPYLMEYLESLVPEGKKPIIEAWVLSHAHMDHIDSFRGFVTNASKYQGKLYLEGIYFSEASDVVMSTYDDGHHHYTPYIHRIGSIFQTTKGNEPQIYRMYTGQRYTFDTVVMDVMLANEQFTLSDYVRASQVTNPSVFNETSTWTMFTINGKKLLTAGDSNYIGKEFVVDNYSEDYLTVDIFTALHHGENINREQSKQWSLSGYYTDNDAFSNAITVKGAVLYSYPIHWDDEEEKTTITVRINSFMKLQRQKENGLVGIPTTYESGSTGSKNPEDYFYHGQGTVVLTFGDSITANVKAKNDWVNVYTPADTTTEE